ncbi:MAG: 50S ribosomal protein L19 [bacterium]|nr:50S ribosomal protein L19 [bacterium]
MVLFHVGDTIRVHYKLIEKEKVSGKTKREVHEETRERTQPFEGIVISIRGSQSDAMFTVRRIPQGGIGIERIFPLVSPWIKNIEIKKRGAVRRAKLYYLRGRVGKQAARIHESHDSSKVIG